MKALRLASRARRRATPKVGSASKQRRGKIAPADPSSGTLVGHCHERNRSFDLSPSLAALVRT